MRSLMFTPNSGPQLLLKILSPREREIGHLVSCGLSNKEIAYRLGIAPRTVRARIALLYVELQLRNRVELTRYLLQHPEALDGDAVEPGYAPDLSYQR